MKNSVEVKSSVVCGAELKGSVVSPDENSSPVVALVKGSADDAGAKVADI